MPDLTDIVLLAVAFLVIWGIWYVFWTTVWAISDIAHGPIIPFFVCAVAFQCWRAYKQRNKK
jgi:hypothetical protein